MFIVGLVPVTSEVSKSRQEYLLLLIVLGVTVCHGWEGVTAGQGVTLCPEWEAEGDECVPSLPHPSSTVQDPSTGNASAIVVPRDLFP